MEDGLYNWFSDARKEGCLDDEEIDRILSCDELLEQEFDMYFMSWDSKEKASFVRETLQIFKNNCLHRNRV